MTIMNRRKSMVGIGSLSDTGKSCTCPFERKRASCDDGKITWNGRKVVGRKKNKKDRLFTRLFTKKIIIISESMDFQSANLLNVRINALSGNLLPTTSNDAQFSIVWKIYSGLIWVIELMRAGALIPGIMNVSREKVLKDVTVAVVFLVEVMFMVMRIQSRDVLVRQFIRKLNDILRTEDETMKNVLTATMKPMKPLLSFYWITGLTGVIIWTSMPFLLLLKKSSFYYEDYRMPVAFSKQPFSAEVFVLGSLLISVAATYMFLKKVGVDIYMMHLVLMIAVQYRYIAVKLQKLFREENSENVSDSSEEHHPKKRDSRAEKEIRAICRHHNSVVQ